VESTERRMEIAGVVVGEPAVEGDWSTRATTPAPP
jgi:hypothetical protein